MYEGKEGAFLAQPGSEKDINFSLYNYTIDSWVHSKKDLFFKAAFLRRPQCSTKFLFEVE